MFRGKGLDWMTSKRPFKFQYLGSHHDRLLKFPNSRLPLGIRKTELFHLIQEGQEMGIGQRVFSKCVATEAAASPGLI